jgi:hypothetical protein
MCQLHESVMLRAAYLPEEIAKEAMTLMVPIIAKATTIISSLTDMQNLYPSINIPRSSKDRARLCR